MAQLSKLRRTKDIVFTWEGSDESLNLKVFPDDMTGARLAALRADVDSVPDNDEIQQHRFLCAFLSSIIGDWDLEDDNGSKVPITEQSLFDTLPVSLVAALLNYIQEAMNVDPTKEGLSVGG